MPTSQAEAGLGESNWPRVTAAPTPTNRIAVTAARRVKRIDTGRIMSGPPGSGRRWVASSAGAPGLAVALVRPCPPGPAEEPPALPPQHCGATSARWPGRAGPYAAGAGIAALADPLGGRCRR